MCAGALRGASKRQRLRSRPAPLSVARLIKLANDVPSHVNVLEHCTRPLPDNVQTAEDFATALTKQIQDLVATWGRSAKGYVLGAGTQEMYSRCVESIAVRDLLASIARQNREFANQPERERIFRLPDSTLLNSVFLRMSGPNKTVVLQTTEIGRAHV